MRVESPERLHGTAITGMAVSALIGIAALLASIAIAWPDGFRLVPISVFVLAGIVFMASAMAAVFAAARDSLAGRQEPADS